MYRGRLSTELIPRTVLETLESTFSSTSLISWRSTPSSRASSFSGGTTPTTTKPLPAPRRRSSIPLFRRRANNLVRFILIFLAIPIAFYLFVTSRTARIRKETLLSSLLEDPAGKGRWPEWVHVPDTTNSGSRAYLLRSRSNEERNSFDGWNQWQGNGQVSFWGNPDIVGPSPFDHVPQHIKQDSGKRVMFLTGTSSPHPSSFPD
jgi:hypothetical protein